MIHVVKISEINLNKAKTAGYYLGIPSSYPKNLESSGKR
jgi:hypothetical protein